MTYTSEELEFFRRFFHEHGLRFTEARERIIQWILEHRQHFTAQDLHRWVVINNLNISRATIYRTISLLTEKKLLVQRDFSKNESHYELIWGNEPHEHIICLLCGAIVEFKNSELEKLLAEESRKAGFTLSFHTIKIYGYCHSCWKKESKRSRTQKK